MKNLLKISTKNLFQVVALFAMGATALSCNDAKREQTPMEVTSDVSKNNMKVDENILSQYFELRNALVDDNSEKASAAAASLIKELKGLDIEKYADVKELIQSAIKDSERIIGKDIDKQREGFYALNSEMEGIVSKMDLDTKVYQLHCPMYGENGGDWLSDSKEVVNPYFGKKMLNCGSVTKEIN